MEEEEGRGMERSDGGRRRRRREEWTNWRKREGSVRELTPATELEAGPVGGVIYTGLLRCHRDSGEGEGEGRNGETHLRGNLLL